MIDHHTQEMDANTVKILNMEHFIDKYVPIRIQKQVGETLQAIGNAAMLKKLENFEMEKFKLLNEDVLNDSDHPSDLKERAKQIQDELEKAINEFKRLARQRGIKYDAGTKKSTSKEELSKSATQQSQGDKSLTGNTFNVKSSEDDLTEINIEN